jgi:hypothetical protein
MSDNNIRTLFVDTSSLRQIGFRHPDFQKLLLRSRDKSLRIAVSHIAWEEWRTQLLEKACEKARNVRTSFEALTTALPSNRILGRLRPPALALWEDAEIEAASKEEMAQYAAEHQIDIIPIGIEHGDRVWRRYFNVKVEPPFNPNVKDRENRRKDIPDNWIFEVAADLITQDPALAALCDDANLSAALANIGVRVFQKPQQVVAELERQSDQGATSPAQSEVGAPAQPDGALAATLAQSLDPFRSHERRVLGFVAYFDTPSKDQLFELLSRSGMPPQIARNAAERLAIAGVIQDTGHHYLITDKRLAPAAASVVEDDIITLLAEGPSHGL